MGLSGGTGFSHHPDDRVRVQAEAAGELGDGCTEGAVDVGEEAGFLFQRKIQEAALEPALGNAFDGLEHFGVVLPLAGIVDQFLVHLGHIDRADGLEKEGLVIPEGGFQVFMVAGRGGFQSALGIDEPRAAVQGIVGMEAGFLFPSRQGPCFPNAVGSLPLAEHAPITGPPVVFHPGQGVQRVFRNIGQGVPEIPFGIQIERDGRSVVEDLPLVVLLAEVLGVHPEPLRLESVRIILAGGQDGCVPMVGHGDVDDDDHILPLRANEDVFDHHVIVLVIPAEDQFSHSFQADMIRIDLPDATIRQRPETDSLEGHGQLPILPSVCPSGNSIVFEPPAQAPPTMGLVTARSSKP